MVQQITQGIKVTVQTDFEGTLWKNNALFYAFKYTIGIENQSKDVVQLTSRFWKIKDALNTTTTVSGEGVIGKKPVLKPGEHHFYSSGCLLRSPIGAMQGYFSMINFTNTKGFNVFIPNFKLNAAFAVN